MINSLAKTSAALINEWPEVFENVEINAIPVMYLDKVTIKFMTGIVWEVDVKNYLDLLEADTIHDLLQELYSEYKNEIKDFEYSFNMEQLRKDVHKFSQSMLR